MDITEALRSIIWGVMSMLLHVIDVLGRLPNLFAD